MGLDKHGLITSIRTMLLFRKEPERLMSDQVSSSQYLDTGTVWLKLPKAHPLPSKVSPVNTKIMFLVGTYFDGLGFQRCMLMFFLHWISGIALAALKWLDGY